MNKIAFLILTVLLLTGCQQNTPFPGEECSLQLSGIDFTRSVNGALAITQQENGRITMNSGPKTDYFNDPTGSESTGTAPLLLTRIDNSKPFTLTAKVTPAFASTYDAGALYLFSDDQHWQKFAFEKDEQARTRIVTVRTIDTSDDNNHDVINQESVYLRISSDASQVGFYYSTDGAAWNLVRLYRNSYPEVLWAGLSSQSPIGKGTSTVFENCVLINESIKDFRKGI